MYVYKINVQYLQQRTQWLHSFTVAMKMSFVWIQSAKSLLISSSVTFTLRPHSHESINNVWHFKALRLQAILLVNDYLLKFWLPLSRGVRAWACAPGFHGRKRKWPSFWTHPQFLECARSYTTGTHWVPRAVKSIFRLSPTKIDEKLEWQNPIDRWILF